MGPESIVQNIEEFIAESPGLLVIEDGVVVFNLASARYSVSHEHGRCLLHLWSTERNSVRRVVGAERKRDVLKLAIQRFGKTRLGTLEICRTTDRRTPTQRKMARSRYEHLLRRVLERSFSGLAIEKLTSTMDLAHGFSPLYTRGLLRRGIAATAVLGVNRQETQGTIDAALTFGILWLDYCRKRNARCQVEGLTLFVPPGSSSVVRERIAHLDHSLAKWRIYELDETDSTLSQIDCSDRGNIATRLVRCPDEAATRARFKQSIERIRTWVPDCGVTVLSAAEVSFRIHGLEFARAHVAPEPGTFRHREEIVFGIGGSETVLDPDNEAQLLSLIGRLIETRCPNAERRESLWRMLPERWLESLVAHDVSALDARLDSKFAYSQVPAFAASDRAMIDVLSITDNGRLALIELKADEDIHLPLQGLDYWARVVWHHQRAEFQTFGYFPGRMLSDEKPLLLLVAPALQLHPATDTLLRYLSPEIDYEVVGIDERWRDQLRVIFRKRRDKREAANS